MQKNQRVIITGGGTAGHVYPGIALAEALEQRIDRDSILFIGTAHGLEASVVPARGYAFREILSAGIPRKLSLKFFSALIKLGEGFFQGRRLIKEFDPAVVVGTGGYASAPVAFAAQSAGIPTIIHEQNIEPGLANKILAIRAKAIAVTYKESTMRFPGNARTIHTGLPIRSADSPMAVDEAKEFGLTPGRQTLLVFGGSLGALSINQTAIALYDLWRGRSDLQVLHITGNRDHGEVVSAIEAKKNASDTLNYQILPYTEKMWEAYHAADLALCRAGASTIAELTVAGLPALLVPYPFAAGKHQELNARSLSVAGAAVVIDDAMMNAELINREVMTILNTRGLLKRMRDSARSLGKPDAAYALASLVLEIMEDKQEAT